MSEVIRDIPHTPETDHQSNGQGNNPVDARVAFQSRNVPQDTVEDVVQPSAEPEMKGDTREGIHTFEHTTKPSPISVGRSGTPLCLFVVPRHDTIEQEKPRKHDSDDEAPNVMQDVPEMVMSAVEGMLPICEHRHDDEVNRQDCDDRRHEPLKVDSAEHDVPLEKLLLSVDDTLNGQTEDATKHHHQEFHVVHLNAPLCPLLMCLRCNQPG